MQVDPRFGGGGLSMLGDSDDGSIKLSEIWDIWPTLGNLLA